MEKIQFEIFDETLFFEKKRINMFKLLWNVSPHKKNLVSRYYSNKLLGKYITRKIFIMKMNFIINMK
jgi:hypothetical protein